MIKKGQSVSISDDDGNDKVSIKRKTGAEQVREERKWRRKAVSQV